MIRIKKDFYEKYYSIFRYNMSPSTINVDKARILKVHSSAPVSIVDWWPTFLFVRQVCNQTPISSNRGFNF